MYAYNINSLSLSVKKSKEYYLHIFYLIQIKSDTIYYSIASTKVKTSQIFPQISLRSMILQNRRPLFSIFHQFLMFLRSHRHTASVSNVRLSSISTTKYHQYLVFIFLIFVTLYVIPSS